MKEQRGYALDMSTPVRHVATMIGDAAGAALPIKEMAKTYKGIVGGDIHRVKVNEKLGSDAEATEWLLEYAVERIMRRGKKGAGAEQVVRENGGYKLAEGVAAESLEYDGHRIGRDRNIHTLGVEKNGDPFNPLSEKGIFAENIRAPKQKDDLKDLCESIEALGYVKDLGIVKDERGVVISGHRRLAALEKLGIEPPPGSVTTKRFGDGDDADMERLKFALALNTAQKPFTAKDRKRIAEYLYGTGEWSMERIGELFKLTGRQIGRDLVDVPRTAGIGEYGQRFTPKGALSEVKQKVIEEVRQGASQASVARKYGVSVASVSEWLKRDCSPLPNVNSEPTSSSKIPEDQQQAVIKGVLDDGRPQQEVVAEITGKPVAKGGLSTSWRIVLAEERGRRAALADAQQQPPAPAMTLADGDTRASEQQEAPRQCKCPQCGWTFTP